MTGIISDVHTLNLIGDSFLYRIRLTGLIALYGRDFVQHALVEEAAQRVKTSFRSRQRTSGSDQARRFRAGDVLCERGEPQPAAFIAWKGPLLP